MATLGKQKTIDTSKFLELGGIYQTNGEALRFKRDENNFISFSERYISMRTSDGSPNTTSEIYFTPRGINSFIQIASGQLQPLQLEFNGINSQIYLRNYDFATRQTTKQINITARGEIVAGDFANSTNGTLDILQGKFNGKTIVTEENVSTISVSKADFDTLVARVTALESAK